VFPNGHAILLYVGRLQARKRIDSLIQVCSQIPEESQPELWIVGDGEILPELKTAAQKYYPKTRFWGALYGSELEDVFQKADLFVLPGTGGLAIQQAMSQALPVIVAEGDGSQSNMVNPQNGWLIPAKDDLALLAAIQDAIGNPQKLREMGSAAFETISKCANIDIMADIFIQTILKVHNLKSKND
jgi:glycosyltransferase involved in cell wall biosynthesis